jgi:serine/threonine protein kinase
MGKCGVPQTTAALESGTEIAGFRIKSLLAEGGMGTVYLATQLSLGREVALKVLSPERSDDPEFQDRFMRESELAASLDHPNVLPVFDAGEANGVIYLAMRYVEGGDLRRLLREQGRIPALLALDICKQIALALDAAHSAGPPGLVHRDVKPANILLGANDHAYLADFGLARRENTRGHTRTGVFMGTPDYAAPEQLEGVRAVDGRADIYSLGCVVYQCLAGQPPYVRESEVGVITAHLHDPIPQLSHVRPDLPPALGDIVKRAMEKNPSDRYRAASELAAELGLVLTELGGTSENAAPTTPTTPLPQTAPRGRTKTILDRVEAQPVPLPIEDDKRRLSRRRVVIVVGAALIIIGAVLGAVLLSRGSSAPKPTKPPKRIKPGKFAGSITALSASTSRHKVLLYFKLKKVPKGSTLRYQWERRSGSTGKFHPIGSTISPAAIPGLKNGVYYRFHAKACRGKICGPWSDWTRFVQPYGRPHAPKLTVTPNGQIITFAWVTPRLNGRLIEKCHVTITVNGKPVHFTTCSGTKKRFAGYSGSGTITAYSVDKTNWHSSPSSKHTTTEAKPVHTNTVPVVTTTPVYTFPTTTTESTTTKTP